jgi:hypothetical protein
VSQSPSLWQLSVHAPFTQRNGEQLLRFAVRHAPRPSHVRAVLTRLPEQLGASHRVSRGYLEQPATPSQVPVRPQLAAPWSVQIPRGSGTPAATGKQLPSREGRLHFTHAPLQATAQQTLSAQCPEAHSSSITQCAPFIFLPQLPFWQAWPLTHWLLATQVLKHARLDGSQENGAQISVGPGLHRPSSVQTYSPTTESFSQLPSRHTVPGTCLRHAPAPSHLPSSPQLDAGDAGHADAARGLAPVGRFTHDPAEPATAHDLHPSVQAVVQQTPSAQNPLAHSLAHAQASPASFLVTGVGQEASGGSATSGRSPGSMSTRVSASDMPPSPASRLGAGLSLHAAAAIRSPTAAAKARTEILLAGAMKDKRMTGTSGSVGHRR